MRKLCIAVLTLALAGAPRAAAADWLFTPFVGMNWGGTADFGNVGDFEDDFEKRSDFGASLAYMGAGAIGFEIDFGWSPNFFENTRGASDFEFGDSNVTTLMANLTLGIPIGGQSGPGFRPYASGGAGVITARIGDADDLFSVDATDWGFNVGAGIIGFFTDNIGLRGDIRYFRSLEDNEPDDESDIALSNFRFWRGSVGLTIRF
jgi:opacity protein-like surface antigen